MPQALAPEVSLDDMAATILNEACHEAISRSAAWRILDEADLKPHTSNYRLNRHAPDFDEKAREIYHLYVGAFKLHHHPTKETSIL